MAKRPSAADVDVSGPRAIVLAAFTYRWIERPGMRLGHWIATRLTGRAGVDIRTERVQARLLRMPDGC